jgi:hypothetical protein
VGKTGILTPVLRHSLEQGQPALWIEFYDFYLEVQSGYKDSTGTTGRQMTFTSANSKSRPAHRPR